MKKKQFKVLYLFYLSVYLSVNLFTEGRADDDRRGGKG